MPELSHSFRAMNTDVTVVIVAADDQVPRAEERLSAVETLFATTEATLSRFRPESELSRLNQAAGQPRLASPILFQVVATALDVAEATRGWFDPTIYDALVAAGYDRSFEQLSSREETITRRPRSKTRRAFSWRDVRIDRETKSISMPAECHLDLGGIGKGWTVDQAVELLRDYESFAVVAGGDLYAAGTAANGAPWTVGIENPLLLDQNILVLAIRDRAVATSSIARRRWQHDGHVQHHLINPHTGRPVNNGVLAVSVIAETVARAEVLAKVALLLGPRQGLAFLNGQPGAEGLIALSNARIEMTTGFEEASHVA